MVRVPTYIVMLLLLANISFSQQKESVSVVEKNFTKPPAFAKPWVFWYWMHAAASKEGIRADLEAMKEVGIGGAYLMPIKDTTSPPLYQPIARQLSPEWWALVKYAMQEAKRLNLKLAMHVSDGFALAGGPWITPELSMQKLVWSKTYLKGGEAIEHRLSKPETVTDYYKDIAVFAYPANCRQPFDDAILVPTVTLSNGAKAPFLCFRGDDKQSVRSDTSCWVQYKYPQPFTCRSVTIHVGGNNYQAQRLIVQISDDGKDFKTVTRLEPPRHGWQDTDEDVTHSIPAVTARYFRFVYNKEGSEPGSEDLDAAKWKPSFKVNGIYLSDEPVLHQYESKNGSIWRVSRNTTEEQVPDAFAVPLNRIINLTDKMDSNGRLRWNAPAGNWVVVRIGHSSTGHTNATGGAGKGLECDKFNPAAVKLQFDNWFAKAFEKTDKALAKEVLKIFHVDSWECGSQNWSTNFKKEFAKRRGYDLTPYLLAMTGVPVESATVSEKFLHDIRQTITELVNDIFYVTLKKLAHEKGCSFSAEAIAPTMVSDGLLHYKNTDMPMGEFWLNSPTHDKPNDMLDAISGAHIYGKNIVQAEAFTSVRMNWGEHPGMLKPVGDRNFALGINKMVLHVWAHNPWMDRKPGMTLDGVGLYFQRDQTWFKQGKAWIDYLSRCQAVLQAGKPVVDIAVFTGEEVPRRAVLPDRLVTTLPGIIGSKRVESEKTRLANEGQPLRTIPSGVNHSANMADPEDWINPLNGYAYDSFNPDALGLASVKNGKIVLPGGASYGILVIPGKHPMNPNSHRMSVKTARKLYQLVRDGATIIIDKEYNEATGLNQEDDSVKFYLNKIFNPSGKKGKIVLAPYRGTSLAGLGIKKDVEIEDHADAIAWTHRRLPDADIYFLANQENEEKRVTISFSNTGKEIDLWHPVSGKKIRVPVEIVDNRAVISLPFEENGSVFVIFRKDKSLTPPARVNKGKGLIRNEFAEEWKVQFDPAYGGPAQPVAFPQLISWADHSDSAIRYYSGTAVYSNSFTWDSSREDNKQLAILFDSIYNIATVKVNGIDCGTLWTKPYWLDITKALKEGRNEIRIEVSNTWANRLIGDQRLPQEKRVTWTIAPFRLGGKPLLPAGLVGRITILNY